MDYVFPAETAPGRPCVDTCHLKVTICQEDLPNTGILWLNLHPHPQQMLVFAHCASAIRGLGVCRGSAVVPAGSSGACLSFKHHLKRDSCTAQGSTLAQPKGREALGYGVMLQRCLSSCWVCSNQLWLLNAVAGEKTNLISFIHKYIYAYLPAVISDRSRDGTPRLLPTFALGP